MASPPSGSSFCWFEDEGEAMTKQALLSADPELSCWLVDLSQGIATL